MFQSHVFCGMYCAFKSKACVVFFFSWRFSNNLKASCNINDYSEVCLLCELLYSKLKPLFWNKKNVSGSAMVSMLYCMLWSFLRNLVVNFIFIMKSNCQVQNTGLYYLNVSPVLLFYFFVSCEYICLRTVPVAKLTAVIATTKCNVNNVFVVLKNCINSHSNLT